MKKHSEAQRVSASALKHARGGERSENSTKNGMAFVRGMK